MSMITAKVGCPARCRRGVGVLGIALLLVLARTACAFPPVPPHEVYGTVRDRLGNPLTGTARVLFEAASGVVLRGSVAPNAEPGVNFSLQIPLDAGLTADLYSPTALRPNAPFKLRFEIGKVTYLPMEMKADFAKLGLPGQRTRLDLTLGVDADGNGLPDDWEKAVAQFLRKPWVAGAIRPDDLYPGTGMSYRDVYLTGVYAMAPKDGIALEIDPASRQGSHPRLAFTAAKGRTYVIEGGSNPGEWSPIPFRVVSGASASDPVSVYRSTDVRRLEVEVVGAEDVPARFFRLLVR